MQVRVTHLIRFALVGLSATVRCANETLEFYSNLEAETIGCTMVANGPKRFCGH